MSEGFDSHVVVLNVVVEIKHLIQLGDRTLHSSVNVLPFNLVIIPTLHVHRSVCLSLMNDVYMRCMSVLVDRSLCLI